MEYVDYESVFAYDPTDNIIEKIEDVEYVTIRDFIIHERITGLGKIEYEDVINFQYNPMKNKELIKFIGAGFFDKKVKFIFVDDPYFDDFSIDTCIVDSILIDTLSCDISIYFHFV